MLELNIDSLTANIDEQNPCGIDVRLLEENSTGFIQYSSLKDTRNNLRREERKKCRSRTRSYNRRTELAGCEGSCHKITFKSRKRYRNYVLVVRESCTCG